MTPPNWFIALPFPPEALPKGELDALPPGTRRFHPDDLHVTVAFLGAVDEATALATWTAADWSSEPALRALGGCRATFGPRHRPSAFGLEFEDPRGELRAFIGRWRDRLLAAADLPPERREVRPHVTMGRPPRHGGDTIRIREWLASGPGAVAVTLDRVALYTRADPGSERRFARRRECSLAADTTNTGDKRV